MNWCLWSVLSSSTVLLLQLPTDARHNHELSLPASQHLPPAATRFFQNGGRSPSGVKRLFSDGDTVPEQQWGKPAIYMSQVTVTCLSAHHFQHRGQTAQQRTERCPTALSVMLGHTAITPLLHNTGAECSPPPIHHHHHHMLKYTHTHLVMPPSTLTCQTADSNHRLPGGI